MRTFRHKPLAVLTLSAVLTACGGGGSSTRSEPGAGGPAPSAIAAQYQGLWIAEGYGKVLDIGGSSLRILDYTSDFCVPFVSANGVDTADVEDLYRVTDEGLEEYGSTGTPAFSAPGVVFAPTEALPPSCENGLTPTEGDSGYQRDPARDLQLFAQILEEYGIYPELRGISAADLYAAQATVISANSSDEALLEALYQMAEPLADIHLTVESDLGLIKVLNKPSLVYVLANEWLAESGLSLPISNAQAADMNAYIETQIALDREVTLSYAPGPGAIRQAANDQITWFENQGLGYLAIDAMLGFGDPEDNEDDLAALEAALDEALSDLQDVAALIVDVRRNGGGKDFLSLAIASRFAANETLAYRKQARLGSGRAELVDVYVSPRGDVQFLGPVILLTSATTASAAEVFTLAMRELPQVVVLGEATQGGLSDQLDKKLTNGWSASVANEYYITPAGEVFEGMGIPVDIEVPQFLREARLDETDTGIEAAIELLSP